MVLFKSTICICQFFGVFFSVQSGTILNIRTALAFWRTFTIHNGGPRCNVKLWGLLVISGNLDLWLAISFIHVGILVRTLIALRNTVKHVIYYVKCTSWSLDCHILLQSSRIQEEPNLVIDDRISCWQLYTADQHLAYHQTINALHFKQNPKEIQLN